MKKNIQRLLSGVALIGMVGHAGVVSAQAVSPGAPAAVAEDDGTGVRDIVVTAQRKSELLQDVPIAVNVVSGAELAQRGAPETIDLPTLVPALTFSGYGATFQPFLRGIGSGVGEISNEASVATYVDGAYYASSVANVLSLANVERIEVLKGPQGTLFGRNTTAGVIQVITREPSETPLVEASAGYGNYDTISGSFYGTTGLTEGVAMDFAAQISDRRDGFGRNVVTGDKVYTSKTYNFRSKLKIEPSDGFKMVLAGDYAYSRSNPGAFRLLQGKRGIDGVLSPENPFDVRSNRTTLGGGIAKVLVKQGGVSLNVSADLGFAQLINIMSYREQTGVFDAESDMTPVVLSDLYLPLTQKNISEELQLQSQAGSPIDWTVGVYYFDSKAGDKNYALLGSAFGAAGVRGTSIQRTKSISPFAQATAEIVPNLKLTAGIRYTAETVTFKRDRNGTAFADTVRDVNRPTWRLALDYAFAPDIHVYASYNRGVKGGGYDLLTPTSSGFGAETLDAYEVGFKSKLFDNRLRFNIAGFYYDYRDIQVSATTTGSGGVASTLNAAKARIKGIDMDFELVPVRNLTISGGAAYIDGKYLKFLNTPAFALSPLDPRLSICLAPTGTCLVNASGNRTVRTPRFTGNISVSYKIESSIGEITPSVTLSHNSGFWFDPANVARQPAYTLLNASLGWYSSDERFGVTVWGNNLTDERYLGAGVPSALGFRTITAAPRTYGVTLRAKFGG